MFQLDLSLGWQSQPQGRAQVHESGRRKRVGHKFQASSFYQRGKVLIFIFFSKVRKGLLIIDLGQKLTRLLEFTLGGVYRRFWVGQRERYLVLRNKPGAGSSSHGLRTGRLFLTA